jgi:hypothetical protein
MANIRSEAMASSRTQCSCAEEVAGAWKRIDSMTEMSLGVILNASAQTVDFSVQFQECQSRGCFSASHVQDILLQIYERLVDLLQGAIHTYTSALPGLPGTPESVPSTKHTTSGFCDLIRQPVDSRSLASVRQRVGYQPGVRQDSAEKDTTSSLESNVVCLPTRMALGDHELDEQQSRYLALELVTRTLRNLAGTLRQIGRRHVEQGGKVDDRVLAILARVSRLTSAASSALHAFP